MKTVGVTGGIGSGKSIVCKVLEVLGYPVFYADAEAKRCMHEDKALKAGIQELLGAEAYNGNETNNAFIAGKIFSDDALRVAMNALVHPAVYRAFDKWKSIQEAPFVFNESALLFETESYKRFDYTILVTADKDIRIRRVMERDGVTEAQVLARMEKQWSDEEKIPLSTAVIVNNPDRLVVPQILQEVKKLESKS